MTDTLQWIFLHLYHTDKANAALHRAPVKFSPLTFAIHDELWRVWPPEEDVTQEMAEVRTHVNQYELDKGR